VDKKPKRTKRKIRRSKEKSTKSINLRDFGRSLSLYGSVFFFLTLSLLPWWKSVDISLTALNLFSLLSDPSIKIGLFVIFILGAIHIALIVLDTNKDIKIILITSSFISGIAIAAFSGYFFITQVRQMGPLFAFISGIGLIYSGYFLLNTKWKPKIKESIEKKEKRTPWVIISLIAFNCLILIIVNYIFTENKNSIIRELSLIGGSPRWYTLFTSTFLHIDFSHFFSNMIVLWWVGNILISKIKPTFFIFVFILSGAIGSLSCLLIDPRIYAPILGASGAIAGLIGLGCVIAPNIICNVPYYTLLWCGRYPVRAVWIFALWIMTQSLAAFNLSIGVDGNVAYWAHLGGILCGITCGIIYLKIFNADSNDKNVEEDPIEKDLTLADKRLLVNKRNDKTFFPQYLIGTSLMITLLAVFLSYSNFTIMGRIAGFQLAWNKGSVAELGSFFRKESQDSMIQKLEKKIHKYDPAVKLGSTQLRISLSNAIYYEDRCDVEYYIAPAGVDPYREPNKCGKIYVIFYKIKHVWTVRTFNFSKFKIKKRVSTELKNIHKDKE